MRILKALFYYIFVPRVKLDWDLYDEFCDNCIDNNEDFRMIRVGYLMEPQKRWVLDLCFPELMNTIRTSINVYFDYKDGLITIEIFDFCQPFENIVREYDRLSEKHILGIRCLSWFSLYAPFLYAALTSFSYKFHAYEEAYGFAECRADVEGTPIEQNIV